MINYLAFITSITLAAIAAFFSIVGLSTIFPGAYWSVIVMAGSLEVGKLVTAAWLHLEWKRISIPIKTYLTSAVIVLMFILAWAFLDICLKRISNKKLNHQIMM